MASPELELFCCIPNQTFHEHTLPNFRTNGYNICCILSASLSISGTVFQLLPRRKRMAPEIRERDSYKRQERIIHWLIIADLLASLAVLVRSSMWLNGYFPHPVPTETDSSHLFCAVISGLIQYFYICTYFWTFVYALDVHLIIKEQASHMLRYHGLCWGLSAVLCTAGLIPLYTPSLSECAVSLVSHLPHYLSTYIPILFVMVTNPIIYRKAFHKVKEQMRRQSGHYTDQERTIEAGIKRRFLKLMLVFYVCWLPNILNGIGLLLQQYIGGTILVILWNFMAVVNPLQAVLNTIAYRGWAGFDILCPSCLQNSEESDVQKSLTDSSEVSPLLSFRRV